MVGNDLPPCGRTCRPRRDELAAERVAATTEIESAQVSFDEIDARIEEAKARARYAEQQLARLRVLHERNGASAQEFEEAQMQDQAMQSSLRAWELALDRRKEEQRLKESERQARIQELAAERTEAEGELQTQAAELIRLERDVELRQIPSPIAGTRRAASGLSARIVCRERAVAGLHLAAKSTKSRGFLSEYGGRSGASRANGQVASGGISLDSIRQPSGDRIGRGE